MKVNFEMSKYGISYRIYCIAFLFILFMNSPLAEAYTPTINKKQTIDIKFDSNISSNKKKMLRQWISHSSDALKLVYGELPINHFIIKIKASKRNIGTVPWGEVSRNYPPEVTLIINPKSTLEELKADWTIYHEFSHLLIPYDAGDARWFSEGLASYYQNIIQARAGIISENRMWQKLYEGFERGRKEINYNHQRLSYLSNNIGVNRNYMRIYWSGALYWLKADIILRKLNGNYSLDEALYQLHKCCFDRYLSAVEITRQLDKLTNSTAFTSLFDEFSKSYALPQFTNELDSLGVQHQTGQVKLIDGAENSYIRRAIFKGK
jgi:hypothetical protein